MNITSTPNRWAKTALKAATVTLALAAAGATGATAADAATAAPAHTAATANGAVLVKEVKTANGVLDVYKVPAAAVRPDSSSGCAGGNPRVCFTIDGSGLYVEYMENSTTFGSAGTVNMQINGPSGVITQTGNFYESGGTYDYTWYPYSNVPGGYYCGTSFTSTTRQGACETVHS